MSQSLLEHYQALCAAGTLTPDPAQEAVVLRLDALASGLREEAGPKPGFLDRILGRDRAPEGPRGIYMYGDVGRGKSMLMDLFFDAAPGVKKRRVHFHAFMQRIHRLIHEERQSQRHDSDHDTIGAVADVITRDAQLLCFDEFHVTDIADAMILGRLFEQLFARHVVVVATSNRVPGDLYAGGINRQLFLPFIAMLEDRLDVVALDADQDYRLAFMAQTDVYLVPADASATARLDEAFAHLVGGADPEPATLEVQGRILEVKRQARHVARFTFAELCDRPLGSADYLALAEAYHTLVIDGIPAMTVEQRNQAKRFVTLIDVLYDNHVGLLCSADAPPDGLYPSGDGAFEFHRTASRLIEMQSAEYHNNRQTEAA
jgi:cell division protein ZapE